MTGVYVISVIEGLDLFSPLIDCLTGQIMNMYDDNVIGSCFNVQAAHSLTFNTLA